mmetsp:Transcript_48722/g.127330  ORF Transcript_48722/g.127330 Transcript_48722/m.127330 type:complete len:103 (-) Transcript_48722:129-437(-)
MVHCRAPGGVEASKAPVVMGEAVREVASIVAAGAEAIVGVLLPSFLLSGRQDMLPGQAVRTHGMSVTEPCLDWAATADALHRLAAASRDRRCGPAAKKPRVS